MTARKSARGAQVAVLSFYETRTDWAENEGVFNDIDAAKDHAALFGADRGAWVSVEHGATRACLECDDRSHGRVWVIEQFVVEPPDPPRQRRSWWGIHPP